MRPSLRDDGRTIGIIGGTGRMGTLFRQIFEDAGCVVEVIGRAPASEYRGLAGRYSVVLITVPISATEEVIRSVAPVLEHDQLIADLTSIKQMPVAAMLESDAQVIGLHPLFGPNMATIKNQKLIMTPARADPKTRLWFQGIFEEVGMQVHLSTPETHDRAVAVTQGIIHLQSIAMAHMLRNMNCQLEDLLPFTTPNAHATFAFMARTLSQDSSLYGGFLQENPSVVEAISVYLKAVREVGEIIRQHDPEVFRKEFDKDAALSASFQKEAIPLTDHLLDQVVSEW